MQQNINSSFGNYNLLKNYKTFETLEKTTYLKQKPKKITVLDQSNLLPDKEHTLYFNNNTYEDYFWGYNNPYKFRPHIDSGPIYTPPYFAPCETGYGGFNYKKFKNNLTIV